MGQQIDRWRHRIQEIKRQLVALGDMRPGAISLQYNVCGTPNCRCKDPKLPQKHGPYYQLSYTYDGKSTTEFVKRDALEDTRTLLNNYATFRKLTEEWVALSLCIAKRQRSTGSQTRKRRKESAPGRVGSHASHAQ